VHHADAGARKKRINETGNEQGNSHVGLNSNAHCSHRDAECHQIFLAGPERGFANRSWLKLSLLRKRKQMGGGLLLAKKNQ
jgi:hypothetical protein